MKKSHAFFTAMALFSILLFSCGSKPDSSEAEGFPVTEAPEVVEENEITQTEEDETEEDINDDIFDGVEDVEDYPTDDGLEEIIDPIVFEEELPPEEETEEITVPEEDIAEPVNDEEISELPVLLDSEDQRDNEQEQNTSDVENDSENPGTDIFGEDEEDTEIDSIENIDDVEDVEDVEEADSTDDDESEKAEENIVPSRSVTMKNGESLDVEYPGKGWIYLGCTDGSKNLTSTGRKLGASNTNFTLQARLPGTVILHFYKEDILAEKYIDDYLEVNVENIKSKSSIHVKAPQYSEVAPAKPKTKSVPLKESVIETSKQEPVISSTKEKTEYKEESVNQVQKNEQKIKNSVSENKTEEKLNVQETKKTEVPQILDPSEYISKAKKAADEKNIEEEYNNLQNFILLAQTGKDEALWMLAQIYEGNSKYRDIKKAIETYEELKDNYPLSNYWEDANKRIIYLQRFYINIR